jgi:endonuclease YncB( thermonuclease family)
VPRRLRRRRRVRWATAILVTALLLAGLASRYAHVGYHGDDWQAFDHRPYIVASVVDGDTVHIRPPGLMGGDLTTVRLLGIDAPEVHSRDELPPDYWASNATEALADLVDGAKIIIRLDQTETRDRYGRLLAYLYESDGDNLNLRLVADGHVYADRRFRHTLRRQFEQTENDARQKKLGLWKRVSTEQMPAWRQRWLEDLQKRGNHPANR